MIKDEINAFSEENNQIYTINKSKIPGLGSFKIQHETESQNNISKPRENKFKENDIFENKLGYNTENINLELSERPNGMLTPQEKKLKLSSASKNYDYTYSRKEEIPNKTSEIEYFKKPKEYIDLNNNFTVDDKTEFFKNELHNDVPQYKNFDNIQESLQFSYKNPYRDEEKVFKDENMLTQKMTEIMGQEFGEEESYNHINQIEPIQGIQLPIGHIVKKERFDKALDLK